MPPAWTDDRCDVLRRMWAAGASYTVIANELGVSRNAVAGKVARLGLEKRGTEVVVERKPRRPRLIKPVRFRPTALEPAPPSAPRSRVPPKTGLTIMELDDFACRWPIADARYCGRDRVPDSPYCADHTTEAYVPNRRAG